MLKFTQACEQSIMLEVLECLADHRLQPKDGQDDSNVPAAVQHSALMHAPVAAAGALLQEAAHVRGAQQGGLEAGHDVALGDCLGPLRELFSREVGADAPEHLQDERAGARAPRDAADQRQDALLGACTRRTARISLMRLARLGLIEACTPLCAYRNNLPHLQRPVIERYRCARSLISA